ncbi:putative methyltransferase [Trypanosoma theileri]|uniref:Ribosomal RNA-processing protein 8 n=1 Tax=Trypanosoma theileri TaxID=67003 RepID=A0A1X0NWQ8_9TRYP|nr:putative methyltransferase [Trypanosoma theileri]ORC89041.1 putative methyltransferase [Trypanosoma theileri]
MLGNAKKRNTEKFKKSAKKESKPTSKAEGAASASNNINNKKKNRNASVLKGPVVSHASGGASRDSANDRRQIPFKNSYEERAYKKANRIPRYAPSPGDGKSNAAPMQKACGASSAAQRRAILKMKNDDDLLEHFRTKLSSSTFRLLNEQIYSSNVAFANQLLKDPSTYADYHNGYQQQLQQWPMKPSQVIIEALLGDRRGRFLANKAKSMPGYIPTSWVIADMGCGDAQIAQALKPKGYTVHSFDFCAVNPHVTVANAAKVPLENDSVDICIFSLSLMSTDYEKCLLEAFRVLKPGRLLKIVEVRSRIPHPRRFAELVEEIGFTLDYHDAVGDYFVAYDFLKRTGQTEANKEFRYDPQEVLVASLYKKR